MTPRSGLHIGSTLSRVEGTPWRVVVHWHSHGNQLIPAGVEVRCYGVEGDDEDDFWGGQEHPNHEVPMLAEGEHTRAASSDLIGKRVKWGQVLGEHAATLSAMLARSADETADLHVGSSSFMREVSTLAGGLTRATDDTYQLVAALYREALEGSARSRPAVYVMNRLIEEHGFSLDPGNQSDRVKVRQWIGAARKRHLLPKATTNTKRKERP